MLCTPPPLAAPSRLDISRTFVGMYEALYGRGAVLYGLRSLRRQILEETVTPEVRRATIEDREVILGLIDEAKRWLPTKGTNQWSSDWGDKYGRRREDRVEHSLKEESTWLVRLVSQGSEIPVATVTIEEKANLNVWPDHEKTDEPVAYLSRLVTARDFSGLHIGAALIDWAGAHARREYGAKLTRIDVWTDNYALHRYYLNLDFEPRGLCPDESYPSRALFQRSTSIRKGLGPSLAEIGDGRFDASLS